MGDKLVKFRDSLKEIKIYLVKIGPDRRSKGDILNKKLNEARSVYSNVKEVIKAINVNIEKSEYSELDITLINDIIKEIKQIFSEILKFEDKTDSDCIMSSFDLKVAVSLLPVMSSDENITKQLIDAIELYDSMLDNGGRAQLINFVLKTRLSPNAKLRLSTSYQTTSALVDDMKKFLLTRSSDTALQMQLLRSRQGSRSIEEFGKELENLFVNLTISQANNNSDAHGILRPLNEKTAIRRFADGLRNSKIGTIVSARNFSSLSEAVRAAQDEEISQHDNNQLMTMSSRGRYFNSRNFRNNRRGHRGFNSYRNFNPNFSASRVNANTQSHSNRPRQESSHQHFNRSARGRQLRYKPRSGNVYVAENVESGQGSSSFSSSNNELNHFFRDCN